MFSEAIIFEDKIYYKNGRSKVIGYIVSFVDNDGYGVREDKSASLNS